MSQARLRQAELFFAGLAGRKSPVPVSPLELARAAHRRMSARAWAYVAGGAGSERTMRANEAAFDRWRIVPRVLRDVSARDTGTVLFGRHLPAPLLLSPVGVLDLAHAHADRAVARAAAAEGIPLVFSNQASVPMEECARVMGDAPRWFQLYWSQSDDVVRSFVRRAERCGCEAIVLTLDTTTLGWRPRDLDLGFLPFLLGRGIAQYTSDPAFLASLAEPLPAGAVSPSGAAGLTLPLVRAALEMTHRHPGPLLSKLRSGVPRRAIQRFIATYSRPSLTWDALGFLRDLTRLPIVLKGILHPEDAARAVEAGMDAVMVSNHGGRQVDGAVGALDMLPAVVQSVAGRVPVLFDSGIRSGADVVKALALGATAAGIGRPYVYGLALAGERGVREVLQNFRAELELTLGLSGCATVREAGPELLAHRPAGADAELAGVPAARIRV